MHSEVLGEVGGCCLHHHLPVCPLPDNRPMVSWKVRAVELTLVGLANVTASGDGYDRYDGDHDDGVEFVLHVHSHKNTCRNIFMTMNMSCKELAQ